MTDTSDDVDFWQTVADFAYMLDGEPAAFRREAIRCFLAHTPDPDALGGSLEDFRRYAVRRLLQIWLDGPMEVETQKRHVSLLPDQPERFDSEPSSETRH